MNMNGNKKERQYYDPRMLLRNFCAAKPMNRYLSFDKQTKRTFRSNIKNIASETGVL